MLTCIRQRTRRQAISSVAALAAMLFAGALVADEPSLDDLLNIPTPDSEPEKSPQAEPAPSPNGPSQRRPGEPGAIPLDPEAAKDLTSEEMTDAFKSAVTDMDRVASRMRQELDPGLPTQRIQESIIKRLDQVIAAAKKQQQQQQSGKSGGQQAQKPQQQQSGSQKNAGKPQQGQAQAQAKSSESAQDGSRGQVEAHKKGGDIEETRSEWGNLPARLRSELIQGRDDKFSSTYKQLTEIYYRRLAEEAR